MPTEEWSDDYFLAMGNLLNADAPAFERVEELMLAAAKEELKDEGVLDLLFSTALIRVSCAALSVFQQLDSAGDAVQRALDGCGNAVCLPDESAQCR